ncbi:MAG: hypothetical protein WKF30_04180 [Pyrinomonadaceae bacterium]
MAGFPCEVAFVIVARSASARVFVDPPARRRLLCRAAANLFTLLLIAAGADERVAAHPLGNFTVNHFTRIEVDHRDVRLRFVVDMAEIAAFQELQKMGADSSGSTSSAALNHYAERAATEYAAGLQLTIDDVLVPLAVVSTSITLPPGAGGLPTLRIECDFTNAAPLPGNAHRARRLRLQERNHPARVGWHEMVVKTAPGITVYDCTAFGTSVTDELKAYPDDSLTAPLDERVAAMSFINGPLPAGAKPLVARDGQTVRTVSRGDRLAELIAVPQLTPAIVLWALLAAAALGALHAFSPGHGKAVVGAYLVGSRGTPRHAAFLGLTVTVTHTLGVFALGLITLFAAQFVLPERLFPILSLVSGALVLLIGSTLFVNRLRTVLRSEAPVAQIPEAEDHSHLDARSSLVHSHGGRAHSHLPPKSGNSQVTWRSLLALGISGGLLPCPSALVVLLSAISRTASVSVCCWCWLLASDSRAR